jgi:hypothetical protein
MITDLKQWLMDALIAAGATEVGPGVGMSEADVSFEINGVRYNINTTLLPKGD